ncbi:MAG: hypothetical protein IH600_11900, partial [Bacteroidetes bacterium]|nr:hypothetical protein [Bacteroidota bacterium]
ESVIPLHTADPRLACGDSLLVAASSSAGPYFSSNGGADWSSAAGSLPAGSDVRCVEGGKDGWVFAAVMDEGKYRMYRGHRANWQWERKDGGITQNESVVDIRLLGDGAMLAITERRVYRSDDLGGWWVQMDIINGANRRLHVVNDRTVLLVNGSNAVHRSTDGGRTWELFDTGLDRKDVADAETAAGGGWCAAGTTVYRCAFPALPGSVQLTGPSDGNANSGAAPTLRWTAATDATAYDVQIGRGPNLSELLFEARWHDGLTLRPYDLATNEEFYWRVRGVNATGAGPWSAAWMFMTGKTLPSTPTLLSPDDGATASSMNPPLLWQAARRATTYDVQVSTDPLFASFVANQQNQTDTTWILTGAQSGVIHYWRVRARNGQGYSGWSRTRSFRAASAPGDAGYALLFDHRGDLVSVPHSSVFDDIEANDELTFEAWVNVDHYDNGFFPVLDKYKPSIDWGWQFSVTSWGMDLNFIWKGAGSNVPIETGKWQHVAVSYKRSDGVARFFINGSLSEEVACDADVPDVENDQPLLIGNGPSGGDEQAFGMIDEVRIWKVARTEQQIHANMNVRINGADPDLVMRMAFDEGSGTATQDASAHVPMAALVQHPEWVVSDAAWGAPSAPRLLLPANAAAAQFQRPILLWSGVTGAESYQLQIATNAAFTSPVVDAGNLNRMEIRPPFDLSAKTLHYWRVRAVNAKGDGPWSTVYSFTTVSTPPPAPRLTSPPNGSSTATLPAALRWEAADGASSYRVQIATESMLGPVVFDSAGVGGTSVTVPGLSANTTYYWHVAAVNASGSSPWSESWSFSSQLQPPGMPLLVEPADSSTDVTLPVIVRWQAVPKARSYQLQVAEDEQFTSPLTVDESGLTAVTRQLDALTLEKTYYWRVRASNDGGDGPWSAIWRFRALPPLPGIPQLITPVADAVEQSQTIMLLWNAPASVDSFRVHLSTAADFSAPVTALSTVDTSIIAGPFDPGSTWFWRVRGENVRGAGPWSESRRFTVMNETGVERTEPVADFRILSIYPHPVTSSLSVRVSMPAAHEMRISIVDMLGREVYRTVVPPGDASVFDVPLALPQLRAGWYVLRARTARHAAERLF